MGRYHGRECSAQAEQPVEHLPESALLAVWSRTTAAYSPQSRDLRQGVQIDGAMFGLELLKIRCRTCFGLGCLRAHARRSSAHGVCVQREVACLRGCARLSVRFRNRNPCLKAIGDVIRHGFSHHAKRVSSGRPEPVNLRNVAEPYHKVATGGVISWNHLSIVRKAEVVGEILQRCSSRASFFSMQAMTCSPT